jgi:hypothetical protein
LGAGLSEPIHWLLLFHDLISDLTLFRIDGRETI